MITLPPQATKLDQHAASLAWSLSHNGIDYEVFASDNNTSGPLYWLKFTVNGQFFLYRYGVLSMLSDPGNHADKVNINHRAELLVADKHKTKLHLAAQGISVPRGEFFRRRSLQPVYDYYQNAPKPLCVKPNNGRMGRCVTASINTFEQYSRAVARVAAEFPTMVVEEHVDGEHFRFFYVEPRVIAIREGIALSVIGNGVSNIATLLNNKNKEREIRNLVTHPTVTIDQPILDYLAAQSLTPESVPALHQRIFLRSSAGHSEAADTIIMPPQAVHPDYIRVVEKACQSVPGLYYCGIDIVIADRAKPATMKNHWIIELNANPGLSPYYYPWEGDKIDVCKVFLKLLSNRSEF